MGKMKIIGAILILLTTTGVGFESARQYRERPRQLRQLKVAIQSLEAEMLYGLTPLAEATQHLAKQMPAPLSQFFQGFSDYLLEKESSAFEAWEKSLADIW